MSIRATQTIHAESPAELAETAAWVEHLVVGLNLCPFARAELVHGRIRYALTEAADTEALLHCLEAELQLLQASPRAQLETSLIICPAALPDFADMQLFLPHADALLKRLQLRGEIQIASFHPDFLFSGEAVDDPSHYSNRSPYPTLHLIREDAISRASASMDDPDSIYENNIQLLRQLGLAELESRLKNLKQPGDRHEHQQPEAGNP